MNPYLELTDIIDYDAPEVAELATRLAEGTSTELHLIERCFVWVRDEIQHSADFTREEVTCSASEVLRAGTGICFAKSHLLAALLRANGIPTGFCYQRLSRDGGGTGPYTLHGFNAVWLEGTGWHRIDPRGNRSDINAQFTPPVEQLAFHPIVAEGEYELPDIYSEPLPSVVEALRSASTRMELWDRLPDVEDSIESG